jgi:hypothetical protein
MVTPEVRLDVEDVAISEGIRCCTPAADHRNPAPGVELSPSREQLGERQSELASVLQGGLIGCIPSFVSG